MSAGFIAILGIWNNYRLISGGLFAVFCIVIGTQSIMISDVILWVNTELTAYFYLTLIVIYCTSSAIFALLNSRFLSVTSFIIALYLLYPMFSVLTGYEVIDYERVLGGLWVIQLLGSLSGVLNGYRLLDGFRSTVSSIWNNITHNNHSGI